MTAHASEENFRRRPAAKRVNRPAGNIEQTLSNLGLDKELEPEAAAQEVTFALEQETHAFEEVNDKQPKFTRRLSEQRKERLKAEALAEKTTAATKVALESAVVAAEQVKELTKEALSEIEDDAPAPTKERRVSVKTLETRLEEGDEPVESTEESEQIQPAFVAAPTPFKGKVTKPSPGLNKLGMSIASMMPGAERVRVEKRLPNGVLGFIADYSKTDLSGHPDLQSFLSKYVKPNHGAGEYKVTGLDSSGRMYEAGSVHLLEPPSVSETGGAMAMMQNLMAQQKHTHEEQIKELKANMSAQPNPVSVLRELHSLNKEMAPPAATPAASAAAESTLAAVITSSSQTMMQMMQMMNQQATAAATQQMQMFMAMQERSDKAAQAQTMMMMEMFKQKEVAATPRGDSMPPPPPPASPLEGMKDLVQILADVGALGGGAPPQDDMKDLLKQMVLGDRMGTKEILELVKSFSPQAAGGGSEMNGFKAAVDNMAVVMNMANQMKQNSEGSPSSTIWDAIGALVSNRDFATSIASAIRVNTEQVQHQTQKQQQRMTVQSQQALQLAAQQRALVAQQQQLAAATAARTPIAATVPPKKSKKGQSVPPPSAAAVAAVTGPASIAPPQSQVTKEEVAAAQQRLEENRMKAPTKLPDGIIPKVNDIVQAVSDAKDDAIVETTVLFVMFLYGDPQWKPFAEKLLQAAQEGNKENTLSMLGGLMQGFVHTGLLQIEVAREVLRCIDQHFAIIHAKISGNEIPSEETEEEEIEQPAFVVPDPSEINELGEPLEEDDEDEDEDEDGDDEDEDDDEEGGDEEADDEEEEGEETKQ